MWIRWGGWRHDKFNQETLDTKDCFGTTDLMGRLKTMDSMGRMATETPTSMGWTKTLWTIRDNCRLLPQDDETDVIVDR
jgi:hypothetical protein